MLRLVLAVLLLLVVIFAYWAKRDQTLNFENQIIDITILLFSDLPELAEEYRKELRHFQCPEEHCVVPVMKHVFESEYRRHTQKRVLLRFHIVPPKTNQLIDIAPPSTSIGGLLLIYRLWREFRARELDYFGTDVRLFVNILRKHFADKSENSIGSSIGRIGFIEWRADKKKANYLWNLTKLAHELGHVFGASDKYDSSGHSVYPEGFVQPELGPNRPQRYVEIMSGTRPTGAGRTEGEARSIKQLRFGQVSAREMGWMN